MTYTPQYPDHGIRIHELFRAELAKRNLFSVLYGHHADDQTDKIIDELWADILRLHAAEQTYIRTYKRLSADNEYYLRATHLLITRLIAEAPASALARYRAVSDRRQQEYRNNEQRRAKLHKHYTAARTRMYALYQQLGVDSDQWLRMTDASAA